MTRKDSSALLATSATSVGTHHNGARVLGSAIAGVTEIFCFHPLDTLNKRLMNSKVKAVGGGFAATKARLTSIIFKDAASQGAVGRYMSLFPGIGFGAGYKVLQRVYKFGGQPFVKDVLARNYGNSFQRAFGEKKAKTMMHAVAGSMIGVGEIVLLPLDVLKIRAQTNPDAIGGKGVLEIFKTEGMGLYRGAGWTAARNAPGSFALFGGAGFVKDRVFKLEHYGDATWAQDFVASIAGSISSITVAAPLDVVKTRIQSRPFDSPESGVSIIKNMITHEGPGAFFKGLVPKIIVIGPKLIFSFTVAQHMISYFEHKFTAPAPAATQVAVSLHEGQPSPAAAK
ncbi:unnamed protein product [Chrysoparadoxa australica]